MSTLTAEIEETTIGWCHMVPPHIKWERIDPDIKAVVKYLLDQGYHTVSSCQGGGKPHECEVPTVFIGVINGETFEQCTNRLWSTASKICNHFEITHIVGGKDGHMCYGSYRIEFLAPINLPN